MTEPSSPSGMRAREPGTLAAWLLLAAAYSFVAVARWHLLDVPLERDEGEYAYFGQLILRGFPPFRLAYTMKLPGTQVAYAAVMAVFGESTAGVRIGLLLVNAATTALLFLLGRRLLGTLGGLATAIAFAYLSLQSALLGIFGHATHFVILAAVAGLLVLHRSAASGRLPGFLGSGALLGVAVLMKQPGGVFLLFAMTWVAWRWRRSGTRPFRHLLAEEATMAAGAAVPVAAVLLWTWAGGTFETLWFWVVRYSRQYTGLVSFQGGARNLAENGWAAVAQAPALWSVAGAGLLVAAWPRGPLRDRSFLLGLAAFSFLGVSAGLYFRPHYFILLLPSASLLVGTATFFVADSVGRGPARRFAAAGALAVVGAGCAQSLWTQRFLHLQMTSPQVARSLYGASPFPESVEVARYLAAHTGPEDRIAVLGSEPQILFYSSRIGASGHVYMYGLLEPQPLARTMQEQLIREVEEARPAYLVVVVSPGSWVVRDDSDTRVIDWALRYSASGHVLVGVVNILVAEGRVDYYWDEAARLAPEVLVDKILVYRRSDFRPPKGSPP